MKALVQLKDPNEFLSKPVRVSEKIDGVALIMKKENDKIKFYNREQREELDDIRRTAVTLYEPAIEYILKQQPLYALRNGDVVNFEYFPPHDMTVKLARRPKHNLVLLRYKGGDETKLANLLGVEPPPIVFDGRLDANQKLVLLSNNFKIDDLKKLNSKYKPLLSDDEIEGIVIDNGVEMVKVTDEDFRKRLKDKMNAKDSHVHEQYFKEVVDVIVHLKIEIPKDYKFSSENYIKVIFGNINNNLPWLLKQKKRFKRFGYGEPFDIKFLDINWSKVPKNLKELMQQPDYTWLKEIARTMLLNLKKLRTRGTKRFPKAVMDKLNAMVEPLIKEATQFELYLMEGDSLINGDQLYWYIFG